MREELTEENLKKYGFSKEQVKSLLDSEPCTIRIENNNGFTSASNESREIISGTEAKYFSIEGEFPFPYDDIDLIEKYYQRKQKSFLERRKQDTRSHYNEALETSRFKELEIKEAEELIEELKVKPKAMKFPAIHIDRLMTYLAWLKSHKGNTLSAFEIALKHWYLVNSGAEKYIIPKAVGEKYRQFASYKNIEKFYSQIDSKPPKREPSKKNLEAVKNDLSNYPNIQNAITNDIDRLF